MKTVSVTQTNKNIQTIQTQLLFKILIFTLFTQPFSSVFEIRVFVICLFLVMGKNHFQIFVTVAFKGLLVLNSA